MLFPRPDAERIRDLSSMRKFMPFISPRRNDALVLYQTEIELDNANVFLEELNKRRPEDRQITLFHLYLRAAALAIHERPGVNPLVAGTRLGSCGGVVWGLPIVGWRLRLGDCGRISLEFVASHSKDAGRVGCSTGARCAAF